VEICPAPVLRKEALGLRGAARVIGLTLRSIRPGWNLIRSQRPDVVYVSTLTLPLWIVLAKLARRPSVCHVHEAETATSRWVRRALALPLLACRMVLANSGFTRDVLLDSLPLLRARTRVVPNSVAGPSVTVPARTELDAPIRVLYLGRLSPRKGPNVAIEAVAELVGRGLDVQLELVGSVVPGWEWYQLELRELISRIGLDSRVTFSGFQPDVWPCLAAADIVVVPALSDESFGNTAVEAILAGRPVVLSSAGGLVEAARGYEAARSVAPGDATAIAAAIEDIVDSWSEVRCAAVRDAEVAAERHSPERYRQRLTVAIDEIADLVAPRSGPLP
jgi:glycosyltransferase involved in cell wall biosynthesis